MNLVQQANFLEDVPKDQLVSMSQDPNAQFPPFLVLSEIQRRTTNEKNYQAMVNQPTTTVAEEVVSDFAQPKGLQGGAPQATPLPTNISAGLSGAPTAPMQMAASGGITGYAEGDQTALEQFSDTYQNIATPGAAFMNQDMDTLKDDANSRIEDMSNFFRDRYTMEDGSTDYAKAAIDGFDVTTTAAMAIPLAGLGIKGLGMGLSWAARTALKAYRSPKARRIFLNNIKKTFTRPSPTGGKVLLPQTLQAGRNVPLSQVNKLQKLREFSPMRAAFTAGLSGKALEGVYDYMTSPATQTSDTDKDKSPTKGPTEAFLENIDVDAPTRSGLGGQMDYRDMIRLGVGVMGAKDMSELGESVTGVLDAQDKRELLGLQGEFTKAQTEQMRANIEAMPKEAIRQYMQLILEGLEAGAYADRDKAMLQYQSLSARLAELEGQENKKGSEFLSNAEKTIFEQSKVV
jgi:hypothetical protein